MKKGPWLVVLYWGLHYPLIRGLLWAIIRIPISQPVYWNVITFFGRLLRRRVEQDHFFRIMSQVVIKDEFIKHHQALKSVILSNYFTMVIHHWGPMMIHHQLSSWSSIIKQRAIIIDHQTSSHDQAPWSNSPPANVNSNHHHHHRQQQQNKNQTTKTNGKKRKKNKM